MQKSNETRELPVRQFFLSINIGQSAQEKGRVRPYLCTSWLAGYIHKINLLERVSAQAIQKGEAVGNLFDLLKHSERESVQLSEKESCSAFKCDFILAKKNLIIVATPFHCRSATFSSSCLFSSWIFKLHWSFYFAPTRHFSDKSGCRFFIHKSILSVWKLQFIPFSYDFKITYLFG